MTWLCGGAIAYLAGLYLGLVNYTLGDVQWLFLLWAFLGLGILIVVRPFSKVFFIALMGIFLGLGVFFGLNGGYAKQEVAPLFYKNVTLVGRIDPLTVKQAEYGNSCVVSAEQIQAGSRVLEVPVKMRISTQQALPERGLLLIKGKLQPLHCLNNPGVFDMETWNRVQGFGGRINKAEIQLQPEEGFSWSYFLDSCALLNVQLKEYFQGNIEGEAGILLGNMLLGGNRGLSEETREIFTANGISHLLAVSGTHIMLLASFLMLLLTPLKGRLRGTIVIICLGFYVLICGFRPSVLRGFFMSLPLILEIKGMERGRLLILMAILFLVFNPLWLLDVGFQLSFGAVAGLLWLAPKIRGYMHLLLPYYVAEVFTITAAAQLGTLPLVMHYFHQFSFLSFLASLLLVPLLEVGAVVALLGFCLHYVLDFPYLLDWSGVIIEQVLIWAGLLSELGFLKIILPMQPLWTWIFYYLLMLFVFDYKILYFIPFIWRRRLALGWGVLFLISVLVTIFWSRGNRLYFLDVGQGDAAVFVSAANEVVVVDTGGAFGYDVGSRVLVPFLYGEGITKIDTLLLSHGDMDHAGGAAGLVRNIPAQKIIVPAGNTSEYLEKLLQVAGPSRVEQAKAGDVVPLRFGYLKILAAPKLVQGNAASLVAELRCGVNSILFTGDLTQAGEEQLELEHSYNILKAAHHGSKSSNSQGFLELVKPQATIISVGKDNVYGHPHQATLERLKAIGTQIYRTDLDGMIKVELLEDGFAVEKSG